MLFFSSNLEILNMVMFILFILNYPCNDSQYFWHILSVSKNNYVDENQFVGKPIATLLGVNTAYSEDFDTSTNGNFSFIVDIDNKKIILKKSETTEEIDFDISNKLHIYIQNIIKEKNKNIDNSFLKTFIGKLKRHLELVLTKNPKYTSNPKNKYVNFFKTSKEIMETNRKIQEICYDFYLNILMIFYQDFTFNSSFDKLKNDDINESIKKFNKLRNLDDNTQLIKEEETFCKYFRDSFKYKNYFESFLQDSVSIDIYKIPFIYTDEFINIKIKNNPNIFLDGKLSLFKIIDSLYLPEKQITINITLNNIFLYYSEKLEKNFKPFFTSERLKAVNRHQLMVLNNKIINKYIYLLNNYHEEDELKDLFPSMQIQENNEIVTVNKRIIIKNLENTLENSKQIEPSHYLIYSFVYIFSIFIPLHSYTKMLSYINFIIKSLEKIKYFKRQYIYILLKSFYKYYLIHKEKHIYPDICISNIKIYYCTFINFLKDNSIIPNEEMMAIINLFFSQTIYQERNSIDLEKDKDFDSKTYFEIEKGKNFLCFMKYCFIKNKIFKPEILIKKAMKLDDFSNVEIKNEKHNLNPIIQIKIKEYIYSSYVFLPKKIYNLSKLSYYYFFDNTDLDINKLNLTNIRDIITNLIQYSLVLNDDFLPTEYLIYTLYLLKDFEEKNNK